MSQWKIAQQQEADAMKLLGWTAIQVAQSSPEAISAALNTFHQQRLAKKRTLPPTCAAEPVIKLESWQPRAEQQQVMGNVMLLDQLIVIYEALSEHRATRANLE